MAIYTIWRVSPPGYTHAICFAEVALCLCASLREFGHECEIVHSSFGCRGRTIVLGAHLLGHIALADLPMDMILWNFEQVFEGNPWMTEGYADLLSGVHEGVDIRQSKRKIEVWDYCQSNIDALRAMGIAARLVPVGYHPVLTRIESVPEPDIDVLFVGSLNKRRMIIVEGLIAHKLRLKTAFDVYGVARDALVARSKVVLNMHFYPSKTFEIVRCSYLYANRKCVVSETGPDAGEMPFHATGGFAPYEGLVDKCMEMVADVTKREECARVGHERFSGMLQTDYLRGVL